MARRSTQPNNRGTRHEALGAPDSRVATAPIGSRFPLRWLRGPGLLLLVMLVYQPVWHAGYVWDDEVILTNNPCIVGPLGLKDIWTTKAADICPLTITAFWAGHKLWGLAPLPYHLVNVLLHAACAILLWRLLRGLRVPGAWLGAAVWALHPVQVESVAWIAEMKNTLSGMFYLLTLLVFLRWLGSRDSGERTSRVVLLVAAWFCAALAMASKSSTMILPVVLCGLAWWIDGRWRWRNLMETGPVFLLSIAAGILSLFTQSLHPATGASLPWVGSWPQRLVVVGDAVWFYLGKLVWPQPLMAVYPHWEVDATKWDALFPLLGVIIALWVLWYKRRTWTLVGLFVLAYFLLTLFPTLGLVDISYFRYSFVADHFLYLASMGPLALVGAGVAWLTQPFPARKTWLPPVFGIGLPLLLGTLSWHRAWAYENQKTLWSDTLAKNPRCWVGHNSLGRVFQLEGQLDDAIGQYEKALQLDATNVESHNNLGNLLLQKGRMDEAVLQYREALQIDPGHASSHNNLGNALLSMGQAAEAIFHYREALKINPGNAAARNNLGNVFLQEERWDEAISEYRETLRLNPGQSATHASLGIALFQTGHIDEAISQFRAAIQIDPQDAKTRHNLATALFRKGQVNEAISQYQEAVRLDPADPETRNDLGNAFAQTGRTDEAIGQYREALRINPRHFMAHGNLGLALAQSGRLEEAILQYEESLKLKPDHAKTHYDLGNALAQMGQLERAIPQYQEALALNPGNAFTHGKLGAALMQQGRLDEAVAELHEAIRLKPDYTEAIDDLAAAQTPTAQEFRQN